MSPSAIICSQVSHQFEPSPCRHRHRSHEPLDGLIDAVAVEGKRHPTVAAFVESCESLKHRIP